MYYVYILRSQRDPSRFYLGYSANLKQRLARHNAGKNPATAGSTWDVVYYEAYVSEAGARRREAALKRNAKMRQLVMKRVKSTLSQSD